MNRGKDICKELKALRRRIADENQIPLETEECTYKGECCGTCPRCDAEVRYLEDALSHRLSIGKAATVAGLALGLAVGAGVQAQNVTDAAALKPVAKEISDTVGKVRVTGVVKNSVTKDPEPFINVQAKQNGELIAGAATDFQGRYNFYLPAGEYEIEFTAVGFKKLLLQGVVIDSTKNNVELEEIILVENAISLPGVVVVKKSENPLIDKDPNGVKQTIEYDGVKVIVK
jgi:hypothetical protein